MRVRMPAAMSSRCMTRRLPNDLPPLACNVLVAPLLPIRLRCMVVEDFAGTVDLGLRGAARDFAGRPSTDLMAKWMTLSLMGRPRRMRDHAAPVIRMRRAVLVPAGKFLFDPDSPGLDVVLAQAATVSRTRPLLSGRLPPSCRPCRPPPGPRQSQCGRWRAERVVLNAP